MVFLFNRIDNSEVYNREMFKFLCVLKLNLLNLFPEPQGLNFTIIDVKPKNSLIKDFKNRLVFNHNIKRPPSNNDLILNQT